MKKRRIRALSFILVVIIGVALWWVIKPDAAEPSGAIASSGFIEATEVSIAMETGGRIVAISTDEGDTVSAGSVMVRLDDSLLAAQKKNSWKQPWR